MHHEMRAVPHGRGAIPLPAGMYHGRPALAMLDSLFPEKSATPFRKQVSPFILPDFRLSMQADIMSRATAGKKVARDCYNADQYFFPTITPCQDHARQAAVCGQP